MAKHWIQICFASSQHDCYYFGCIKRDKCEQFKQMDTRTQLNIKKENQNENKSNHHD